MANALLESAVQLHKAGQLSQAERAYRELIAHNPSEANAWHLLGVLAKQCGRAAEAVSLIEQAVLLAPGQAVLKYNLAGALRSAGRLQEAIGAYIEALALQPDLVEACQNLGSTYDEIGDYTAALRCFRRCVELRPTSAEAATNLARALLHQSNIAEAIDVARRAVALDPQYAPAGNQLGLCLSAARQYAEAQQAWDDCLRHDPKNVAAWVNLGRMLHDQEQWDEALQCFERALQENPDRYEVLVNLGVLQKDLARYDSAIATLGRAAQLAPTKPEAWLNLGKVHEERGDLRLALSFFDQALKYSASDSEIRLNRALVLIQLERFAEGWDQYESRWHTKGAPPKPHIPLSEWQGESRTQDRLLVYGEQGIGDQIMFASCIPDMLAQAVPVALVTERRLAPLFRRSFPTAEVHVTPEQYAGWDQLAQHATRQIAIGSLPRWLRRSANDFPQRDSFLIADPAQVTKWRERYAELGAGLKVGISWRAGTTPQNRRHRSAPIEQWKPLVAVPGVQFVCLQYGATTDERSQFRNLGAALHHWPDADPLADLDDFAAQLTALDLVISIGNSTVHMAGALGTRCWALLPCYWGWRWGTDRTTAAWYRSVRLLRQQTPDDWDELFTRVAAELMAESNDYANLAASTAGHLA